MGAALIYLLMSVNIYWHRSKNYEQGQMPLQRHLPRWATRRRCISTRAESRIDRMEIMSANNY
jgi:hypothetical protein